MGWSQFLSGEFFSSPTLFPSLEKNSPVEFHQRWQLCRHAAGPPLAVQCVTLMRLKIKGQCWASAGGSEKHVRPCNSLV